MDSTDLVIKVKYGDTLRRFTAYVDENGLRNLDMVRLKNMIHALFNFPPNTDFTLTYTDAEKDEVALVDDKDMYDAITQKLNPLRITLNATNRVNERARFKPNSAKSCGPMKSAPHVVRIPTPATVRYVEIPNHEIRKKVSPHDLQKNGAYFMATKIKEALDKMDRDFASESSKSTNINNISHPASQCPTQAIKTPPVLSSNKRGLLALNGNIGKKHCGETGGFSRDYMNNGRACHIGIRCDGCWVNPILGPLFKSKVKENNDLCSVCYSHRVNEADHVQVDVPVAFQLAALSKKINDVDASLLSSADGHQAVEATLTCTDVLTGTQVANNCTPPEIGHMECAAETVNLNPAIDNGIKNKNQIEFLSNDDSCIPDAVPVSATPVGPAEGLNPVVDSSLVESEPSADADTFSMEVGKSSMIKCFLMHLNKWGLGKRT